MKRSKLLLAIKLHQQQYRKNHNIHTIINHTNKNIMQKTLTSHITESLAADVIINESNQFTIEAGKTGIETKIEKVGDTYVLTQHQGSKTDSIHITSDQLPQLLGILPKH